MGSFLEQAGRSQRRALMTALAVIAAGTAVGVGCVGRLENPERFTGPSRDFQCADPSAVPEVLLKPKCGMAGCHTAEARTAGLDLMSPDLVFRLFNAPSTRCEERTLLRDDALSGHLFDKLEDAPPCGERMPLAAPALTEEEKACLHAWLYERVREVAIEEAGLP
jgi:hypothetical protein